MCHIFIETLLFVLVTPSSCTKSLWKNVVTFLDVWGWVLGVIILYSVTTYIFDIRNFLFWFFFNINIPCHVYRKNMLKKVGRAVFWCRFPETICYKMSAKTAGRGIICILNQVESYSAVTVHYDKNPLKVILAYGWTLCCQ